ncbi:MAG: glycerol-3-phosphate cytidylyltransferase [Sulfurovaceae bacterium]|nr:glycerol-3-phosphate cytidylyltransferase [Sulfurovaceae bacterium]
MKKTIITYGTFDMFHIGHLKLLQRLKDMADELIVAVSTDEFNSIKGKKAIIPYEQRAEIVANIKCVDKVIPEECWEQKVNDIKKFDIDIFAIGDDWKGKFDFLKEHCEVIYLERTKDVSTTELKKSLSNFMLISKEDILNTFEIIEALKNDKLRKKVRARNYKIAKKESFDKSKEKLLQSYAHLIQIKKRF